MEFHEQQTVDENNVKHCDVCNQNVSATLRFNDNGLTSQKNIWGFPNGNVCVNCVGKRELKLKNSGKWTGKIIDVISWETI